MNAADMLDADMREILQDESGFAETVLLRPARLPHEPPLPDVFLRAFFGRNSQELQPGQSRMTVLGSHPVLTLLESDMEERLGRSLCRQDCFDVRGTLYRVENARPDSFGSVTVRLLAVKNTEAQA